jgi:hypothetical protein
MLNKTVATSLLSKEVQLKVPTLLVLFKDLSRISVPEELLGMSSLVLAQLVSQLPLLVNLPRDKNLPWLTVSFPSGMT